MALTTTRPRTTSPPGHWETTGRFALALCSLVLGTALASTLGAYVAVAALQALAALGLAVVYPDLAGRLHRRLPGYAWPSAVGVVAAVLLSALRRGSIGTVLLYVVALAGLALVASPLFHVGPKDRR